MNALKYKARRSFFLQASLLATILLFSKFGVSVAGAADEPEIDVSALADLRSRCTAFARQVKDNLPSSSARFKTTQLRYGEVKAAADSYIDQFLYRLTTGTGPSAQSLDTARDEFVQRATDFLKYGHTVFPGTSQGVVEVAASLIPALAEMAVTVYKAYKDANTDERHTIETQVEGLRFKQFSEL